MKKIEIEKISISSETTIRQAMKKIDVGEIGAALIVEKNGILKNLITDGDIRRALLKGYGLESLVSVIPSNDTCVVKKNIPPIELSKKFNDKIRIIPVVDDMNRVIDIHFKDKR